MLEETSFGIIPFRKNKGRWEMLVIQHHAGHWSFPKGHPEEGETPLETAKRELKEETGLDTVSLLGETPFAESYFFTKQGNRVKKTVVFFAAKVDGILSIQKSELINATWVALSEAQNHVTFPSDKALCRRIMQEINL